MKVQALIETAQAMITNGKGLLAMDERDGTCNQRFASAGIPQTVEMRRAYRALRDDFAAADLLHPPRLATT